MLFRFRSGYIDMTMVEVSRVLVFDCLLNFVGVWYKFHLKGKGLKGQGVEVAE